MNLKLKIKKQGAPIVNIDSISICAQTSKIIAAEIDMHSKWCEIGCTFGQNHGDNEFGFAISATERSLHLNEDVDGDTVIIVDGLRSDEWEIFTAECCRYTIRLVLVKVKK